MVILKLAFQKGKFKIYPNKICGKFNYYHGETLEEFYHPHPYGLNTVFFYGSFKILKGVYNKILKSISKMEDGRSYILGDGDAILNYRNEIDYFSLLILTLKDNNIINSKVLNLKTTIPKLLPSQDRKEGLIATFKTTSKFFKNIPKFKQYVKNTLMLSEIQEE